MAYVKVWFGRPPYDEANRTAGLVMEYEKVRKATIDEISRFYPMSESPKMHHIFRSPQFPTWKEAFEFEPADTSAT